MAKPPPSPPSSDIDGVNRDARIGTPSKNPGQGSAEAVRDEKVQSKARPEEGAPAGVVPDAD